MSYLIDLAARLAREMPQDTILLCRSRAAGRRLISQAAKIQPLVGVRAETPLTLAAELCSAVLSEPNAPRLLSEDEAVELMLACMEASDGFFTRASPASLPLAREVYRTYVQLEHALIPLTGESEKQKELEKLCRDYGDAKKAQHCWDRIDLLRQAGSIAGTREPQARIVALPGTPLTALECRLIWSLAGRGPEPLPMEDPEGIAIPAGVLLAAGAGSIPPFAHLAGHARFFACRGADAEVDFVFRDIFRRGKEDHTRLDDIAVICMTGDYARRVYDIARRYYFPIQMGTGLPFSCSNLHMALQTISTLRENHYDAEKLRDLLFAGCLSGHHPRRLARALRKEQVGWGDRGHYMEFLARLRKPADGQSADSAADEDTLEKWSRWFNALFDAAGETDVEKSLDDQKEALRTLLSLYSLADERERAARALVSSLLEQVRALSDGETLLGRLLMQLQDRTILAGSAAPGSLLCVGADQALCTGAKYLYFVGLSRDCFSGGRESSVLLDEEKEVLMAAYPGQLLKTCEEREKEKRYAFCQAVAHNRAADFTFSYSDFDTAKLMPLSPCALFETMRQASGAEKETVSLIPSTPLSAGDTRITAEAVRMEAPAEIYDEPVPLPAGEETEWADSIPAEESSMRDTLREYVFSASSMEEALRCPLQFYLHHILHLAPSKPPRVKLDTWLEKNEIGTFCHKVLERYYRDLPDDPDRRNAHMEDIFHSEYEALLKEKRTVGERLRKKTENDMRSMVEKAIAWTEREGRRVLCTERGFGTKEDDIAVQELKAGARTFRLKGSIDRVDQLKDGSLSIVDYKTGDPDRLEREKDYHLQHYLYKYADLLIRKAGSWEPDAVKIAGEAGYLLLADEVKFLTEDSEDAEALVEQLLNALDDEDTALSPAPWVPREGRLERWGSWEEQRKFVESACMKFCGYRELCPLAQEGGGGK